MGSVPGFLGSTSSTEDSKLKKPEDFDKSIECDSVGSKGSQKSERGTSTEDTSGILHHFMRFLSFKRRQ